MPSTTPRTRISAATAAPTPRSYVVPVVRPLPRPRTGIGPDDRWQTPAGRLRGQHNGARLDRPR